MKLTGQCGEAWVGGRGSLGAVSVSSLLCSVSWHSCPQVQDFPSRARLPSASSCPGIKRCSPRWTIKSIVLG